jgi:hypothetical protein
LGRWQILRVAIGNPMAGFERLHVLYSPPRHLLKAANMSFLCFENEENLEIAMSGGGKCQRADLDTGVRQRSPVPQDIGLNLNVTL